MRRLLVVTPLLLAIPAAARAQDSAIVVTKAQIEQGINLPVKSIDRQIRILDLNGFQEGITAAKHEANKGKLTAATGRTPESKTCGAASAPAGAQTGPGDGIFHADTTETYVILTGTGTLVSGGRIINGFWSSPNSDTDKIETGPSCIGPMAGTLTRQVVGPGDVVVIPAGVAHGWVDLEREITYLIIRTDTKSNLEHGYVNPGIK